MICVRPRVRSPRSLSRRFGIVRCIPDTDLSGCISYRCQRRQYAGQRIGIRTPNIRYSADPDVDLPWVMRSGAQITRFGTAFSGSSGGWVTVYRVKQRVKYVEIR